MTTGRILELVVGVLFVGAGIWHYRQRGKADPQHGSQGAVLLLVVGAFTLIHALGLLDYRPSPSEIERARQS